MCARERQDLGERPLEVAFIGECTQPYETSDTRCRALPAWPTRAPMVLAGRSCQTCPMASSWIPKIGEEFAAYRLEEMIGHGGMSIVYRARHRVLERAVALKLLSPELSDDAGVSGALHP